MTGQMELRILIPGAVLFSSRVESVLLKTAAGWWSFLPHHCAYTNIVEPGVLEAKIDTGTLYAALDSGIVTKKDELVTVAVRAAVVGKSKEIMVAKLNKIFTDVDAREEEARSAAARLERDFVRWFTALDRKRI